MRIEDYIAYICSTIGILLAIHIRKYSKRLSIANVILWVGYSAYCYYGLYYRSEYGAALAWWFYLLFVTILHIVGLLLYTIFRIIKKRK